MMRYALCHSHRARDKLIQALARPTQAYYSFKIKNSRGIIAIVNSEVDLARSITGVSIMSVNRAVQSKLGKCWSGSML